MNQPLQHPTPIAHADRASIFAASFILLDELPAQQISALLDLLAQGHDPLFADIHAEIMEYEGT